MTDRLLALRAFVRTAHSGSLSRAGRELGLSQPSVSRILAKLDVRGRTEAAAVAYRLHLAAPPGSVTRR